MGSMEKGENGEPFSHNFHRKMERKRINCGEEFHNFS
jgi:hypothetical protein